MRKAEITWVIDDDPIFVLWIKKKLKLLNFSGRIEVFKNGKEAISKLESVDDSRDMEHPDLIFLDLNMPVMNGWQFLGELSKVAYDLRSEIYIVSSSVDPVDVNRGQTSDKIRGYLVKPLKSNQLEKIFLA